MKKKEALKILLRTYADYTPINTSAAQIIALAQSRGVGVINGSPLAFGLMTGTDPRANPRIQGEWKHSRGRAAKLYDFCKARGLSVLSIALQFPLLQPAISMTLTGPGSPEELFAGLEACRQEITDSVWRELHTELGVPLPPYLEL